MARTVPAAARALEILSFLAAQPDESFTLSELARVLDIGPGTIHALLATIEEAGYVDRDPVRRRYSLGPAAVAVGHAALERRPEIDLARDEVRRLAREHGCEAIAATLVGEEILMVARAGRERVLRALRPRTGQRLPHRPPIGAVFAAWAPPAAQERWAAGGPPEHREVYAATLRAVRRRGYDIGLRSAARDAVGAVLGEFARAPRGPVREHLAELLAALGPGDLLARDPDPGEVLSIDHVMAPVFDNHGRVVLALTLLGIPDPITTEALASLAERVVASATYVSRSIDGAAPSPREPTAGSVFDGPDRDIVSQRST